MKQFILLLLLIFLSACSSFEGKSARLPASRQDIQILIKGKEGDIIFYPHWLRNEAIPVYFHADEETANGLCKYFKYKRALRFTSTITDADVTWLNSNNTLAEDQNGGYYNIESLVCQK